MSNAPPPLRDGGDALLRAIRSRRRQFVDPPPRVILLGGHFEAESLLERAGHRASHRVSLPLRGSNDRAILWRPDDITTFGEARFWSESTRLDLRTAEVPTPRPGDRIEIPGSSPGQAAEAFLVQGEPVRDQERLVWTVDLRPV